MYPDVLTPATLLEEGAEVLETGGWVRGHYRLSGQHCAVGALQAAAQRNYRRLELSNLAGRNLIVKVLSQAINYLASTLVAEHGVTLNPETSVTIIRWNDEQAKDQYQVIDLFRLVAKQATSSTEGN